MGTSTLDPLAEPEDDTGKNEEDGEPPDPGILRRPSMEGLLQNDSGEQENGQRGYSRSMVKFGDCHALLWKGSQ